MITVISPVFIFRDSSHEVGLPAYLQVSPAADDGLLEFPHHLQGVAEVAGGLGLTQPSHTIRQLTGRGGRALDGQDSQ